jgi:Raf kinase inhibitor-like YbhB/YbcL family protein
VFILRSSSFEPDAPIPARHTCDGDDLSPPLTWSDAPVGTQSFALLMDDPDAPDPAAPRRVWVHWLRYNLPPGATYLPEGAGNQPPSGDVREALTDADAPGYHGPCPPVGRHRYFFHLFALDCRLPDLGSRAHRADFEQAMAGHELGLAILMGTYIRSRTARSGAE